MTRWTDEQRKAVELRGSNLLVAAAAGSGKTAVLVERIIRLIIDDGIDVDRLLVVTFTGAAASEMRERISMALLRELELSQGQDAHVRRQLSLLNRASISTLHAFCLEVVRRHFQMLDIDPGFRIASTAETDLLKLEAAEEIMEQAWQEGSGALLQLAGMFAGKRSDLAVQELVLDTHRFIQSQPYPQVWLQARVAELQQEEAVFFNSAWARTITRELDLQMEAALNLLERAMRLVVKPGGPCTYEEALQADMQMVAELREVLPQGLTAFYEQLGFSFQRLRRAPRDVDPQLQEQVKALREEAKKLLNSMKKDYLPRPPRQLIEEMQQLYPAMQCLAELVGDFSRLYQQRKTERGIVDFNDLEHYALAILQENGVAQEYRERFVYVFVDEYQDSNLVQDTLLELITRDNNLFLVGDIKQSIYRFRLADPSLFLNRYQNYQDGEGVLNRRIDLTMNFRSQEVILAGVNGIFTRVMSTYLGEIHYDERAALRPGGSYPAAESPDIEVVFVEKAAASAAVDDDLPEDPGDAEIEARFIAGRIKELIGESFYDQRRECWRPIDYRDIVVLLRTTKNWSGTFMEVFAGEGIPAYADVNTGYFDAVEIELVLNLLRIVDNIRQDIPLLGVLRSPLFAFSSDDLITVRLDAPAVSYYEALEAYGKNHQDELAARIQEFMGVIRQWRKEARYLPIHEFIWKIYMDSGYYHYAGAMPGGAQRQANLRILVERARQFHQSSIKGLFNFIKFMERLIESSGDLEMARILGENDNVVRMMSIHKSKGLEFPVVIVAGLGKQFNLSDSRKSILFHKDLGLGPRYVNSRTRRYCDTVARIAMKKRLMLENLSEEMRILYVAMTRPQARLIMVGTVRDVKKAAGNWSRVSGPFDLSRGRSYLDWIGPVLVGHRDGGVLRERGEVLHEDVELQDDGSAWKIRVIARSALLQAEVKRRRDQEAFLGRLQEAADYQGVYREAVSARLDWAYAYGDAPLIPSKMSVTGVQKAKAACREAVPPPALVKKPRFMMSPEEQAGEDVFSAAQRGSLIHFFMQHVDLEGVGSKEAIQLQITTMVEKDLLTEAEAAQVDVEAVAAFFASELGQRVLRSARVYREVPFNQVVAARDVLPDLEMSGENLLLQGVIDLYFEEEGSTVLVDYKTDSMRGKNAEEMKEHYQTQLRLYRDALERISGERVKETYLYLFSSGEAVRLD